MRNQLKADIIEVYIKGKHPLPLYVFSGAALPLQYLLSAEVL